MQHSGHRPSGGFEHPVELSPAPSQEVAPGLKAHEIVYEDQSASQVPRGKVRNRNTTVAARLVESRNLSSQHRELRSFSEYPTRPRSYTRGSQCRTSRESPCRGASGEFGPSGAKAARADECDDVSQIPLQDSKHVADGWDVSEQWIRTGQ